MIGGKKMNNVKMETIGEALGLEKDKEKEITALVKKIVNSSQAKDEIIKRIEKQGLDKKELHYALFFAGGITITRKMKEQSFIEVMKRTTGINPFADFTGLAAEIKEVKERLKEIPEDEKREFLEKVSEDNYLILPDGRCKCDVCDERYICPIEEFMRFVYEEIRKLEDKKEKKKKKGFKVKIE